MLQCSVTEQGGVVILTPVTLKRGTHLVHSGTPSTLTLMRLYSTDHFCLMLRILMLLTHGVPSKMLPVLRDHAQSSVSEKRQSVSSFFPHFNLLGYLEKPFSKIIFYQMGYQLSFFWEGPSKFYFSRRRALKNFFQKRASKIVFIVFLQASPR